MTGPPLHKPSAGGVLIRRAPGGYDVCLILRRRYRGETWCLPKGHLEPGEDTRTAALREVQEETGYAGDILASLGTIAYQVTRPGKSTPASKTVSFFLMQAPRVVPGLRDAVEVEAVRWMSLDEAMASAAYDNERQILAHTKQLLAQAKMNARIPHDPTTGPSRRPKRSPHAPS